MQLTGLVLHSEGCDHEKPAGVRASACFVAGPLPPWRIGRAESSHPLAAPPLHCYCRAGQPLKKSRPVSSLEVI